MKIRFILVLLISVLFLRCATVVHGTQVIRFRNSVAADAIAEEQPLLPSRSKPLLASAKKQKTCLSDFFGDFNMDGISHEYHVDGHPVHPPAMHVPLHPSIVLGLHHYKLVPTGSKLLLLKRSIPNNKGSPASACISTHSKQLQFQTNELQFYFCLSLFRPASLNIPVIGQPCPYPGLRLHIVPGIFPPVSIGVLPLSLYGYHSFYTIHPTTIHAPHVFRAGCAVIRLQPAEMLKTPSDNLQNQCS